MATIGLFLSLALYAPALLDPTSLMVETMQGSIIYHLSPLYNVIPTTLVRFNIHANFVGAATTIRTATYPIIELFHSWSMTDYLLAI